MISSGTSKIDLKQLPIITITVTAVSVIVLVIISILAQTISLFIIGTISLLLIATRKSLYSILLILCIFTLFPFLAILFPIITETKYTVIKDILYLIVLGTAYLIHRKRSRRLRLVLGTSYLGVYITILILFWILTAPNHMIGLTSLRGHIEFALMALVIPLVISPRDPKRILLITLVLTSLIALVHIIDFGITHHFVFSRGTSRTLFNTLNPNVLGTLYAIQLAVLISIWRHLVKKWRHRILSRALLFGLVLIMSGALVVTLSRRNMIALALSILIGFFLLNRPLSIERRILTFALIALILFILFQYAPAPVQDRLQSIIKADDIIDYERQKELKTFGSEYLTNIQFLLMGQGFGFVGPDNLMRGASIVYFHNYYLILLSDSGLAGLLLFLGFIGTILFRSASICRYDPETEPILFALFQGTLVVLISNLFGTTLMTIPVNVFFWCYVGLMIYLTTLCKNRKRSIHENWN